MFLLYSLCFSALGTMESLHALGAHYTLPRINNMVHVYVCNMHVHALLLTPS